MARNPTREFFGFWSSINKIIFVENMQKGPTKKTILETKKHQFWKFLADLPKILENWNSRFVYQK